jgi:hypothetical protein
MEDSKIEVYHVLLDLTLKSSPRAYSEVPFGGSITSFHTACFPRIPPAPHQARTCAPPRPPHVLNHHASGLALQPAREHVPPGSVCGHLELEVARDAGHQRARAPCAAVVRRVVPWPVAKLVDMGVPTCARGVVRSECFENIGHEGGL